MHFICKKIIFCQMISLLFAYLDFGLGFGVAMLVFYQNKQLQNVYNFCLVKYNKNYLVISDKTVSLKCFQKCLILTSNLQGPSWQRVILVPNEWFSMFLKNLG